jgi:hypothetical protein
MNEGAVIPCSAAFEMVSGGTAPRKSGRFRRFLIYLILTSGFAYGGSIFLALKLHWGSGGRSRAPRSKEQIPHRRECTR